MSMITVNAQIPNNGFENWTTVGSYEDPNEWGTMNMACAGPFFSCTKSMDHYPANVGSYSMRLENNLSLTQYTGGWGMAITDSMAYPFEPAFPLIGQPTSLCGYYKFLSQNNDSVWFKIVFFNQGVIIHDEDFELPNTTSWSSFNIPFSTYPTADSATILIAAFLPNSPTDGPNGNSVLYIDNLSFDNLISGVIQQQFTKKSRVILGPNPASTNVNINIDFINSGAATLNIYNLVGDRVKTEILTNNQQQINIEDLEEGVYLVEIKSKGKKETQRLIIQR